MLNFTEEIKNEIISVGFDGVENKLAALSAFIKTSGSIISHNGYFGFELITENERTANFVDELLTNDFNVALNFSAKFDEFHGRDKFTFSCANQITHNLLQLLYVVSVDSQGAYLKMGIANELVDTDEKTISYIKGAFLGGGSCTIPEEERGTSTGYHLQFSFGSVTAARDFCDLLCDFEILAKLVTRKDSYVVYVKSKEVVSDILNVLSAETCRNKLNKVVEQKDKSNNANRVSNCAISNIDKTVMASVNQVKAIEVIQQTIGLKSLDKLLFEVATARIADKNASMLELATRLGISKSCINHRMRKIIAMANELMN